MPDRPAERLPLWRNALERMLADGVAYGHAIPTAWFEEQLREPRTTVGFAFGVHEIRKALEKRGYALSARGQKGEQFVILPAAANASVLASFARKAADALRRGVILGTNTDISALSAEDRRRHESMLEKIALKSLLIGRSRTVARVLEGKSANLLKPGKRKN